MSLKNIFFSLNVTNFRCLRIFNGKKQKAIRVNNRSNASPILIGVIMHHRCNCPFVKWTTNNSLVLHGLGVLESCFSKILFVLKLSHFFREFYFKKINWTKAIFDRNYNGPSQWPSDQTFDVLSIEIFGPYSYYF